MQSKSTVSQQPASGEFGRVEELASRSEKGASGNPHPRKDGRFSTRSVVWGKGLSLGREKWGKPIASKMLRTVVSRQCTDSVNPGYEPSPLFLEMSTLLTEQTTQGANPTDTLGEAFYGWRRKQHVSISQVAQHLKIPREYLYALELGLEPNSLPLEVVTCIKEAIERNVSITT